MQTYQQSIDILLAKRSTLDGLMDWLGRPFDHSIADYIQETRPETTYIYEYKHKIN